MSQKSPAQNATNHPWICVLIGIIVILSYSPTILQNFASSDDYLYVYWAGLVGLDLINENQFFDHGRPILSLFIYLAFTPLNDTAGLILIRAISLFATAMLGITVFRCSIRIGYDRLSSSLFTALTVLNPGFCVFIGWAVCYPYPIAALFAFLLGELLAQFLATKKAIRKQIYVATLALFGLILVLCVYQTVSTFFLLPYLLRLLFDFVRSKSASFISLIVWFSAHGIYFLLYQILKNLGLITQDAINRGKMVTNISDKFEYLRGEPSQFSFGSWLSFLDSPYTHYILSISIFLIISIIILINNKQRLRIPDTLLLVGFLSSFLFLSAMSFVILESNFAPYRVMTAFYAMLAAIYAAGFFWIKKCFQKGYVWALNTLAIILLGAIITTTYARTRNDLVAPLSGELKLYSDYVNEEINEYPLYFNFLLPNPQFIKIHGKQVKGEFYKVSTFAPWVPRALFSILLNTKFGLNSNNSTPAELSRFNLGIINSQVHEHPQSPLIDGNQILGNSEKIWLAFNSNSNQPVPSKNK